MSRVSHVSRVFVCVRVCSPLLQCTDTQWETRYVGFRNEDRQCKTLTVCDPVDEYEKKKETAYSDRECGKKTVCKHPPQYETRAPSPTSDRECGELTVCKLGSEYASVIPGPKKDRVCKAITMCKRGQFEVKAPTATSDRVCKTATQCNATSFESVGLQVRARERREIRDEREDERRDAATPVLRARACVVCVHARACSKYCAGK